MKRFAIAAKNLACIFTLITLSAGVLAQANNAMVKACRSDVQSLCPSVKPGGGRVAQCLQQHASELSPACKAQLSTISECSEQVKQICGTEATTPSAVRSCISANASKFSTACRGAG
jgi:hypothetical protein